MRIRSLLLQLNFANQLTFLRLVAVPFFVVALLQSRVGLALVILLLAAVTDLLDGLTARMLGQATELGAYLDPLADKLLLTSAFVMLTQYPSLFQGIDLAHRIPIWLTIFKISRDVIIVVVAGTLYLAHQATRFPPSRLGKATTACEFLTVSLFLTFNRFGGPEGVLQAAVWVTLGAILASGFHYLWLTVRGVPESAADAARRRETSP